MSLRPTPYVTHLVLPVYLLCVSVLIPCFPAVYSQQGAYILRFPLFVIVRALYPSRFIFNLPRLMSSFFVFYSLVYRVHALLVQDCAGLDDRALLRFLRSRQFRIPESTEMAVNYLKWYNDNHIAEMAASLPGKVELMGRLVPHAFHGFDRHGHPVYIERAGAIDPYLLMSQVSDNEILMSHVWGQENQIRRCDESSRARGLPPGSIERFTTLMDLKGMTMTHRACLKFTKKITEWDEKYVLPTYITTHTRTHMYNALARVCVNIILCGIRHLTRHQLIMLNCNVAANYLFSLLRHH